MDGYGYSLLNIHEDLPRRFREEYLVYTATVMVSVVSNVYLIFCTHKWNLQLGIFHWKIFYQKKIMVMLVNDLIR